MKIEVIENSCTPELEKKINKLLKKGWEIRGNLFKGNDCLTAILQKN